MTLIKLKEPCYAKEYKTISRKIHSLRIAHQKKIISKQEWIHNRREKNVKLLNKLIKQREDMRV